MIYIIVAVSVVAILFLGTAFFVTREAKKPNAPMPSLDARKLAESMLAATGWRLGKNGHNCLVNEKAGLLVHSNGVVRIWPDNNFASDVAEEIPVITFNDIDINFIGFVYHKAQCQLAVRELEESVK